MMHGTGWLRAINYALHLIPCQIGLIFKVPAMRQAQSLWWLSNAARV